MEKNTTTQQQSNSTATEYTKRSLRGSLSRQAPLSRTRHRRCGIKNRTREFVTVFKVFEDLPSDDDLEKYKQLFIQQQEKGFIDRAGLSLILEKMGRPMSHAEMRHLINSMDSRRIDFSDFLSILTTDQVRADEMESIFSEFDKDNNGEISFEELKLVMKEVDESLSDADIKDMMKEVELNENGCVDFKSFSAITRTASETLSSMAGRYIASNQIGRCLSPRLKHTSRVRERISRGDTVNLEVPDVRNADFAPTKKSNPPVLMKKSIIHSAQITLFRTFFLTKIDEIQAPRSSVTKKN